MDAVDEHVVFRSLFAAYPDALLLVDADGRIALANPAAERLLLYPRDGLRGVGVDALVPDAVRARHAALRAAYAVEPQPRPMGAQHALVARRADGSTVMVEIALSPLTDHGLPYVVAAVRDVSAFPRVVQALRRARYSECLAQMARLAVDAREPRALLQRVPAEVCATLEVDSTAVFLLGASRREFVLAAGAGEVAKGMSTWANTPHTALGCMAAQGLPQVVDDYAQAEGSSADALLQSLGVRSGALVPLADHGRVIGALCAWTLSPRRFDAEALRFLESLASLLVTTLQRAESEAALQHAQRLESVGQLTGGIAHDFNNLLTVIHGNLQVLEELPAVSSDPVAPQLVAAAERATRRGAELTGKLLAFSRRQLLQPSRVDVGAMLHSLAGLLRRTLDQRIRIQLDLPASGPWCVADAGQLESALLNIAINARDAMPDGGLLSFAARASNDLGPEARAALGALAARAEGCVAIAITDSGSGMNDEVRARAFEPFFTTKDAGRGTGLGLATVYGFISQSQGSVSLDSAPGEGTTVTLFLPRSADGQAAAAESTDDTLYSVALPPGLAVLLVEDEPEVRRVVQALLESLGCTVQACDNAEQALQQLDAGQPCGLLLSDVALGPGLRGTELVRLAPGRRAGLPVLLMSGFASNVLAAAAAGPLLRKPFGRGDLARAIARVLPERAANPG